MDFKNNEEKNITRLGSEQIDVVIMNEIKPDFLYVIVKTGKVVYTKKGVNKYAIVNNLTHKIRENLGILHFMGVIGNEEYE